ncbi:putative undecaprenyl-diphosphatase YbjG [Thiomonas sp. X19]|uniref:phosphatase PAP2 family protein n=1 Tax=Thiomonas sp. X19 TaxID=1050370 RepID=UPI000B6BAFA6|nr:phosphatase PAP2 family protein [Thiomonas sp. X19]SCC94579.1 putative undecaprenyl-diphosphatase YbjG [Thiomonas sp. X19]
MLAFNTHVFLWLNAAAHPAPWLLASARFAAQDLIFAAPLLLVAGWLWRRQAPRAALVHAALAALLGLGLNQLIGLVWTEPRPFVLGIGHRFLAHAADSSFPSDHLTVIWGAAFALLFHRDWRRAGFGLALLGLPVAWARIYLGVHWPLDMVGAAAVGLASALLIRPWHGPVSNLTAAMNLAYHKLGKPLISRRWIQA